MIHRFMQFEIEMQLFEQQIAGINYWHLIRSDIYREIAKEKNDIKKKQYVDKKAEVKLGIIKKRAKQIMNLALKNPLFFLEKKDVLIFNHPRRVLDENVYKCLYTYDLIDKMNCDYYVYEIPYDGLHFSSVHEDKLKYTDLVDRVYWFEKNRYRILNKSMLSKKDDKSVIELVDNVNRNFNVNLDIDEWKNTINNRLLFYKIAYKIYSKILEKIQPKVIIQVVSYEETKYVINKIASERNIPTIELQHGTMGKYHIAYNFSGKMEIETFPDYVFTFGDYWKEVTRLPIPDSQIISVGWPFYEKKMKEYDDEQKNKNKKTILFISQGTIGKELSQFALKMLKKLDATLYQIIYKLHPGEYDSWKTDYPYLLDSKIKVIDNNNHDMHHYFNQVDIQIGVYSTAIFEGLGYNLDTYIVNLYGHEYMEDLYKKNYVTLVNSVDETIQHLSNKKKKTERFDTNYFWQQNSLETILNEINKIVEDHTTEKKTERL